MNRLFCKGFTWGFMARTGEFQTKEAEQSMERLAADGCDWICIPVNCWQEHYYSRHIFSLFGRTQSDADIRTAVEKAHSLGMKVCFKPMIDCLDSAWRAHIDFPEQIPEAWDEWFSSFDDFILYYSDMAEALSCEMLCFACEMNGMYRQGGHCRETVKKIREVYHGPLMIDLNHGDEFEPDWLDCVDILGISAYYPVTDGNNCSYETQAEGWKPWVDHITRLHEKWDKPVLFAEVGVRSERGCTADPANFDYKYDEPVDEKEQADFYRTCMEATKDLPFFSGYFWWDWKAVLPPLETMHEDLDFAIYGKEAEKVLKEAYGKM